MDMAHAIKKLIRISEAKIAVASLGVNTNNVYNL